MQFTQIVCRSMGQPYAKLCLSRSFRFLRNLTKLLLIRIDVSVKADWIFNWNHLTESGGLQQNASSTLLRRHCGLKRANDMRRWRAIIRRNCCGHDWESRPQTWEIEDVDLLPYFLTCVKYVRRLVQWGTHGNTAQNETDGYVPQDGVKSSNMT